MYFKSHNSGPASGSNGKYWSGLGNQGRFLCCCVFCFFFFKSCLHLTHFWLVRSRLWSMNRESFSKILVCRENFEDQCFWQRTEYFLLSKTEISTKHNLHGLINVTVLKTMESYPNQHVEHIQRSRGFLTSEDKIHNPLYQVFQKGRAGHIGNAEFGIRRSYFVLTY